MIATRRSFLATPPALALAAPAGKVTRWAVVTIGNLSRNRYWGESEAKPLRDAICTCTLVSGPGFQLVVDPSLKQAADMARELDRRTGVKLDQVTAIFVTHEHADHLYGIEHFPKAEWFAAEPVAAALNATKALSRTVKAAPARICTGAVEVVPTPGHTRSHHSLIFECERQLVAVAGDSVPTRDFWRERRSYFNAVDPALGARSMDKLAARARFIVPGHDNYFAV